LLVAEIAVRGLSLCAKLLFVAAIGACWRYRSSITPAMTKQAFEVAGFERSGPGRERRFSNVRFHAAIGG
jgi:hypothetical protein